MVCCCSAAAATVERSEELQSCLCIRHRFARERRDSTCANFKRPHFLFRINDRIRYLILDKWFQ